MVDQKKKSSSVLFRNQSEQTNGSVGICVKPIEEQKLDEPIRKQIQTDNTSIREPH